MPSRREFLIEIPAALFKLSVLTDEISQDFGGTDAREHGWPMKERLQRAEQR